MVSMVTTSSNLCTVTLCSAWGLSCWAFLGGVLDAVSCCAAAARRACPLLGLSSPSSRLWPVVTQCSPGWKGVEEAGSLGRLDSHLGFGRPTEAVLWRGAFCAHLSFLPTPRLSPHTSPCSPHLSLLPVSVPAAGGGDVPAPV